MDEQNCRNGEILTKCPRLVLSNDVAFYPGDVDIQIKENRYCITINYATGSKEFDHSLEIRPDKPTNRHDDNGVVIYENDMADVELFDGWKGEVCAPFFCDLCKTMKVIGYKSYDLKRTIRDSRR